MEENKPWCVSREIFSIALLDIVKDNFFKEISCKIFSIALLDIIEDNFSNDAKFL